ncbi:sulfurtransferase TusA family protein [Halorubellus salinus]|uniref:sulfurtransferase TusA family protein n=1 Tax=Halorubellus salinus TaxID=755309 RepID=UPI001D077E2E|nr:sulfurtransferase TusA family protein [Halorubellus salinus]
MKENSPTIEDADDVVDVTGQVCAMPILSAADALQNADAGDLLAIRTGKPEDERDDVEDWVTRLDGASFIDTRRATDGLVAFARRTTTD